VLHAVLSEQPTAGFVRPNLRNREVICTNKTKTLGEGLTQERGLPCSAASHIIKEDQGRLLLSFAMRKESKKKDRLSIPVVNQLIGAQMKNYIRLATSANVRKAMQAL
jgi:hypothetical protein